MPADNLFAERDLIRGRIVAQELYPLKGYIGLIQISDDKTSGDTKLLVSMWTQNEIRKHVFSMQKIYTKFSEAVTAYVPSGRYYLEFVPATEAQGKNDAKKILLRKLHGGPEG
jgi:hypothetical protein